MSKSSGKKSASPQIVRPGVGSSQQMVGGGYGRMDISRGVGVDSLQDECVPYLKQSRNPAVEMVVFQ